MFGAAGREHMEQYGTTPEHFAKIGVKNHKHSVNNPYAQFQQEYTLEEILGSPEIYSPLTKLQCSPTSDGSGAAVLASEAYVDRHGLADQAVEIVGQALVTDLPSTFETRTARDIIGYDMNVDRRAGGVRRRPGSAPRTSRSSSCTTASPPTSCGSTRRSACAARARRGKLIDNDDTTYGGRWVVNPSGGLISKGHPLGATGLAQCAELTWQLRGTADKRQVGRRDHAALQHNVGLGGSAVVSLYQRAER